MPRAGLALAIAVGRFDIDMLRVLLPLLDALRSFPRHASVWDLSYVDHVESDAFVGLQEYFAKHFREPLPVDRVAVIAPPEGPLRAVAAGMFSFLAPPYPVAAFDGAGEALDWIGVPRDVGLAVIEVERAALVSRAFDDVVAMWIEARVTNANLEACAAGLGVSRRTLQRRLSERGTSFEEIANRARVRVAQRLLATDAPLATVAFEAGFASPERFSRVFREITGETPSGARARLRAHE